jgi:hypothetical protein
MHFTNGAMVFREDLDEEPLMRKALFKQREQKLLRSCAKDQKKCQCG